LSADFLFALESAGLLFGAPCSNMFGWNLGGESRREQAMHGAAPVSVLKNNNNWAENK
jgi:hypothetical protein